MSDLEKPFLCAKCGFVHDGISVYEFGTEGPVDFLDGGCRTIGGRETRLQRTGFRYCTQMEILNAIDDVNFLILNMEAGNTSKELRIKAYEKVTAIKEQWLVNNNDAYVAELLTDAVERLLKAGFGVTSSLMPSKTEMLGKVQALQSKYEYMNEDRDDRAAVMFNTAPGQQAYPLDTNVEARSVRQIEKIRAAYIEQYNGPVSLDVHRRYVDALKRVIDKCDTTPVLRAYNDALNVFLAKSYGIYPDGKHGDLLGLADKVMESEIFCPECKWTLEVNVLSGEKCRNIDCDYLPGAPVVRNDLTRRAIRTTIQWAVIITILCVIGFFFVGTGAFIALPLLLSGAAVLACLYEGNQNIKAYKERMRIYNEQANPKPLGVGNRPYGPLKTPQKIDMSRF
jgi:hypothetical protein